MTNETGERNVNRRKIASRQCICIFLTIFLFFSLSTKAQLPTQQLRVIVIDQVLQTPVQGATLTIPSLNKSVLTNAEGEFRFGSLPIGVIHLSVTAMGYKELFLNNINLISGKETVLTFSLENSVKTEETIIIRTSGRKNKPLNDMSAVSARAFSVEETQKYAAAVNDPSRMATGFPGVVTADDGSNNIIIRGNSPTGLLWRMEGVDIPNPNHFSSTGSSGGGISILSAQLLSNSDFITGAFASEYGNALSGVFDLKLRRGNNEKREYTLQAGLLGLNAAAEGPILPFYDGSYLVNYRYSTLEILNKMGISMEGGATNFQDLSYHVYLPTKRKGTFTLFGFGGLSNQKARASRDSTEWKSDDDRNQFNYVSNTGAAGITHSILLSSKSRLRSAFSFSYNKTGEEYYFLQDDLTLREDYKDHYRTSKWTASTTLNHKFSGRSILRAGAILSQIGFDYYKKAIENEQAPLIELINTRNNTRTIQAFTQWQYKPANDITINGGFHFLKLLYNNTQALEPRASLKWQADGKNSFALGYGGHSQVQAFGIYFAENQGSQPNKELDLTRAHHYIFSYQRTLGRRLSFKAEIYYQHLYQVPVSIYDSLTLSVLNMESEYVTEPLVNKGKGRNYGIELSLEKYLEDAFYYTISTSIYQSKYTAADGIERNTRFNGNYITSLVAGKDFYSGNKLKTFGINIKTIYSGGLRTTPIDETSSIQQGYAVYKEKQAFSNQNPAYFRTDLRLSMKWNRKNLTSTLSLDIQNLTNRLNVYGQWYDDDQGKVVNTYQVGIIPVINYKVEF